jgi:uroporphyrinogen-III synthase
VNERATPPGFGGARVLLLESRLAAETATMVRRLGGRPVSAPSVLEVATEADADVRDFIQRLERQAAPGGELVTFLTGAAVARIFAIADLLHCAETLQVGLARATIVARGPKPAGALARRGLTHAIPVASPYTTADVLTALNRLPVAGRDATVVHYGERNEPVVASLRQRGAVVRDLMVYEWRLPADVGPLSAAIDAVIGGEIEILAVTSQVQLRHMLEVAGPRRAALIHALNSRVLVGAVGPTCAAGCYDAGISDVVVPQQPKLAPLLAAIATAAAEARPRPAASERKRVSLGSGAGPGAPASEPVGESEGRSPSVEI